MKKIIISIMSVIMLLSILSGCKPKYGEHIKLKICGSYAVPGMMQFNLKGLESQYEVIEQDSCGRVLFSYTTSNCITDQEETAYLIAQKISDDYVYFYEDICYQFSSNDFLSLKVVNDWGKELNYDKMTKRTVMVTFDQYITRKRILDYGRMKETYCEKSNVLPAQIHSLVFMDNSESGKEMYLMELETDRVQKYLFICDENYHIHTKLINGDLSDYKLIAPFKESCGWYQ